MSAATPAPRARDERARGLRRAAFDAERVAVERDLLAKRHPENVDLAAVARSIADRAWDRLWAYLDGLAP
jgi:hypothetical protein